MLTVNVVFLVDVKTDPKLKESILDPSKMALRGYIKLINKELSSPKILAEEGTTVKLVTT